MITHDEADAPVSEKTIVIRDRRKPNQYTTDNLIAREWLPILRVGDAFFLYSVYLSMANRETESSWGSLRTMAQYLQCGVDLVIRGNKLLEICELIYVESGSHCTTNEYYILDPPPLTLELKMRIYQRLAAIAEQETSQNWQSWSQQVRKVLDRHQSLPDIWAARRANKGGRPVKIALPQESGCVSQAGFSDQGGCEPQAGLSWATNRVVVNHKQGGCEPQPEQEQLTRQTNKIELREEELGSSCLSAVRFRCQTLGVAPTVVAVLLENHPPERIWQQLEWLPARNPRDPAAMLVKAVQEGWSLPTHYDPQEAEKTWTLWEGRAKEEDGVSGEEEETPALPEVEEAGQPELEMDAESVWERVLEELEMQMTRATFDRWLRGTRAVGLRGQGIVVSVRDGYAVEWLRTRLLVPVLRTVAGVAGQPWDVFFEASS